MLASPQDRATEALSLSLDSAKSVSSPDISNAASVTLLIHGVGDASYDTLLKAAGDGYAASGFGRNFERRTIAECPVLWGPPNAAECLVLDASGSSHILIALPWARRRLRLSVVARFSALLLLQLAVLAIVTFAFRHVLEFIVEWLKPTSHRMMAYLIMLGFSALAYLLSSDPAKKFKSPPMSAFFLPLLLLVGVMFFVEGTWLWVLMALPLTILGLMSTIVILRCLRIAPTVGWRLALIGLICAIALTDTALIGIARKAELRSERRLASIFDDPSHNVLSNPQIYKGWMNASPSDGKKDLPDALFSIPATEPKSIPTRKPADLGAVERKPGSLPQVAPNLTAPDGMWGREAPTLLADWLAQLVRHIKWTDLVTWSDLTKEVIVTAGFVMLCLLISVYGWLLDFGFDVLHYTGKERLRTSLIEGVATAIRWINQQAPNVPIVVVGHSLGSVLAAHAVASLASDEPCLKHTVLVTMGSPLNYLSQAFPSSVQTVERLSQTICERVRWVNFWRRRDPIGKKLNIGDRRVVQRCVGKGGHPDYWSDRKVWRAVAREGLGVAVGEREDDSDGTEYCIFERGLGTLVAVAILALIAFGAGLWAIAF
jgi:hypothetical protein